MKKINLVFFFILLVILSSCSSDNNDRGRSKLENEKHHVKLVLTVSDPNVRVFVESYAGVILINDYWQYEYDTTDYLARLLARVDENDIPKEGAVIIKGSIYVDGKLDITDSWENRIEISSRLKGTCEPFCQ